MGPDRARPKSPQHAKDVGPFRGAQRDGQGPGQQAPEEAPSVHRRRERAPQIPRDHSLVPPRPQRLVEPMLLRALQRLQDHPPRLLLQEGAQGRGRGFHHFHERERVRVHPGRRL